MSGTAVRDAAMSDLAVVQEIYAHHVRTGFASFELEPPDLPEIERRFRSIRGKGLPFLAACRTEVRENGCGRIAMWRGHGIERFS